MNFSNINLFDFIDFIKNFNNVDNILDDCKTQSEKGFIFERLFDLVIKLGYTDIFNNSQYSHLNGNMNECNLKIIEDIGSYLNDNNVISGKKSGCSDITLLNKNDNSYIFISSKYPKSTDDINDAKSVKYYDIQNITSVINKYNTIYKKYKIYLLVPNKKKVLDKARKANKSSEYITDHIKEDCILDKDDLNNYFNNLKVELLKYNNTIDFIKSHSINKDNLKLRFHQELITNKTVDLIKKGNNNFLWGCKCRSGKTFMFGGIISKLYKNNKKLNVLIITPAPTETAPQFTEDLFNKYNDFEDFKIHHIDSSKSLKKINLEKNNIIVISKQLLQQYTNEETITKIKNLKLDIIGFDENHFGGTTNISKDIINSYSSKNTIKIYLTATYNKPLHEWNILPECQMYWDIEDEHICKNIYNDENNIYKLKEKHGDYYVTNTINNFNCNTKEIFKSYLNMPELHIITNMFDMDRYDEIKRKLNKKENKYGFCFETIFGLNIDKTRFIYEDEVKTLLRYISGSNKEDDGDKTIYTRINKLCETHKTRKPFTQIWFLPPNNINEISCCIKDLMKNDRVLKQYDVLCINSKNDKLASDIKNQINNKEIDIREKGKRGLILLAGNMLSLGITLNLCDMVILMNDTISSDKILQQMYRCMTEGIDKKIGYVVDLNISRVLNTCINYTTYKNNYSIADKLKYIIEYNLINIDVDMIDNKEINTNNLIKKLMDIWKEDPVNHFKILLRKLDNEFIELDNETQKKLNKYFQNIQTNNKISSKILLKNSEDELQSLPKGNKKTPINSDNDSEDEDIKDDNTKEEQKDNEKFISFTHDILPDIIPLVCILTMDSSNMDFIEMINSIKNNPELLGIFDEQCNIWWKKTGLIEFIKEIISKFVNKESTCYNISIQIKMSIQSLIDKPAELLELINECLKPKDIEKKNYGEVFTPMPLINEMLDKLPEDVWSNKNMKWLDPASGMGNFPIAVYMRLMDGLKNEIVDEKLRKKHIIENMLYMCELNKKNVLVCKEIFDINNEYKLNIYNGDTLLFEPLNYFNIKKFDIIIGNPPYQEKDKSGDNKLYLEFTSKCLKILKKNRYLLFITPRTILEYLLLVGKNRTYIDYLYQINYLSIETSNRYFPNIGSTFVYFLLEKTECYKNTTIEYINSTNKEIEKIDKLLEKGFRIPRSLTATDLEILSKITSNTINYKLNDFIFDNKSQRIRKEHLNKNVITIRPTDTHNIKIIDTINKEHKFPGKYYYYNKKDSVYDKDKLVLSKKGYLMPYVDRTKDYTYSDNFKYIIDDNMDTIKMLLESPIIKYLLYQYSKNGFDSIDIIKNLTKRNLDNVNCENDLYIIYNITNNEIEHIQNITKTTINNRDRLKSNQDINDTISIKSTQSRTQYTVDILKNMCKERNIKGISKLSKKDLAIKLFDYHNNDNNKASSSYISLTDDEIKEIQILIDK